MWDTDSVTESRAVEAQSRKATIQPGFLTYQEDNIFPLGPHLPWWKRTEKPAGCSPWALGLDTPAAEQHRKQHPPYRGFVSQSSFAARRILNGRFPFPPSPSRTRQTQRTRAPGTTSRTWPPSCPSCLGSRTTGWNCTIKTGTPPPPTHPTHPRATFRLRCEDAQTYSCSRHMRAHTEAHGDNGLLKGYTRVNFCKGFAHAAPRLHRCAPSDPILYLFTTTAGRNGERRLFYGIFSQKDNWNVRTGARHVCDWFLNELEKKRKQNYEKLISGKEEKKVLILFCRGKKRRHV